MAELLRLFGKLGIVGFGGPTAHISLFEDEIVAKRGWMPRQEFIDVLAATNILPGPNSTEMAIHVGHRRAGVPGGILAGVAFIAPSFLMMLVLSWAYFRWSSVAAITDVFDGIKPAVIAILAVTLWRLFRSSVRDVPQLGLMAAGGALAYAFTAWEPLILIAAGLVGIALYVRPAGYPRLPMLAVAPWPLLGLPLAAALLAWKPGALGDLSIVFLRAGGLLFGGGYVLIPLIQDAVTKQHGWLTQQQFIDGVALGQATPGPIIITATFVGYAAAGLPGAAVATVAVFAPAFVFAIGAGSFLQRVRSWKIATAFLQGVAPAVVGSIAAVSAQLARDAITDAGAVAIAAVGIVLAWRYGPLPALAVAGAAGIAIGQLS
ncbi:MAG: chromate efflux transporter [Chloroflexi bacterium]|nr:chromate efflux transporter [Chloroflexota bacterium]